jgi:hypothetical protein
MLNSAPIAAKTPATLANLKKLHPHGENPAPLPHQEVPRFTEDVVRKALCSFGPGSAAGLFGYKPFLLQQCVRAESFVFTRALTSAVNEFACGRAPAFLNGMWLVESQLRLRRPKPLCGRWLVVTLFGA